MLDIDKVNTILDEIRNERQRQYDKWGEQLNNSPSIWLTILMEEVGEAAKALLERDAEGYRTEMVQVAAVAAAMVEHYDHFGKALIKHRPNGGFVVPQIGSKAEE